MNYRMLGSTGLECSTIGLGTVKLGRMAGLKYAAAGAGRLPTDEEALGLLQTAADAGVNLIDTSPAYGVSEERLGMLLSRVRRTDGRGWLIVTKAGEAFEAAANGGAGESTYDFSPRALAASVERSLVRLRVEAVECVLLHFSGKTDEVAVLREGAAMGALAELRAAGKVRAIGASTSTTEGGLLAIEMEADVVMVTINQRESTGIAVAAAAETERRGVLVKKALGGGHFDAREAVVMAASRPGVSSVVIGTTNPAHLLEVVPA